MKTRALLITIAAITLTALLLANTIYLPVITRSGSLANAPTTTPSPASCDCNGPWGANSPTT